MSKTRTMTLSGAIENAYRVFAAYRIRRQLDFAARVGASEAEHRRLCETLATIPLRLLPLEAIDAYFDYVDAAHYDGKFQADELRYFLPRALELLTLDETERSVPFLMENLTRSLERGKFRSAWPAEEVQAVEGILQVCRMQE